MIAATTALASITFILSWGTSGSENGQFLTPAGINVDSAGNVYVAEGNGNRVQKFDNNGNFIRKFGFPGDVDGGFVSPSGVAVDAVGRIYVTDQFTNRVSKFDSTGVFFTTWGGTGSSSGRFLGASGVAVDSAGDIYVSDSNNHRIQKFDSGGVFIMTWGSNGSGDGELNLPSGIAIDSADNVYVADTGNNRIEKFDLAGNFVAKWGTAGSGNGEFNGPTGVSVNPSGTVVVADTGNSRIQTFSNTGTFQESFGSTGSGDGQFSGPQDVAIDSSGNIFVADTGNDRVQKLGAAAVVADAGPDQTVECAGATTPVTLNGTASSGGGTLSYTWKEGATTLGTGAVLNVSLPTGTHTIVLTVASGGGSNDDTVLVNVVDNAAPTLTLNGANPMTVECHTSFTDPGATASDGCAGNLTSAITVSGSVNSNVVGAYVVTYSVTDGSHTAAITRTVNVVDTLSPTITLNGPNPMTVECHSSFVDPGATASDGCAGNLTSVITVTGNVNPNVVGTYVRTYSVSDGAHTVSKTRTVKVVDTTAPVISLNGYSPSLRPADHDYHHFHVSDFVTGVSDNCGTCPGVSAVVISKVTSDEPENSNHDGNTLKDIVIAPGCRSVKLRAERNREGNGRVYTITFKVRDAAGNTGTATAKVTVPRHRRHPAVDDGPHFTVMGNCL
jgi:DNA-binding beta-propeller fold protein YncE